jgi:hypothetical protein
LSGLVRTYSGGMRRKLDLGASLVGAPRLLLLLLLLLLAKDATVVNGEGIDQR